MKNRFILILILAIVTSQVFISCKNREIVTLRFENPLLFGRNNDVVSISYNNFANHAGDLPPGTLPVFFDGSDTLISQNIDLNNDGTPEEILLEISLRAEEKKDIKVEFVPSNSFPSFPKKTNLHFAMIANPGHEIDSVSRIQTIETKVTSSIFQMEGPAWENDKVGFRNYFDLRNGMDVFGKIKPDMVLDTIGLGVHSYHLMSTWGMDILKVGASLGAGGIGMEKDRELYRIGDNGSSRFERIYEGPLKSEFAFHFNNWKAGEDSFNIIHYISITAGSYRYENEVFADFPDTSYRLIAGIVNKQSESVYYDDAGESHILLATQSVQAENNDLLGMAFLIPRNQFISYDEAPKIGDGIIETYFARILTTGTDPARYYFYAGWATGNSFLKYKENFVNLIKEDALKLENPIQFKKVILP